MRDTSSVLAEIESLLSEPLVAAAARERMSFGELMTPTNGSVVLFGAGKLGRLCARALRRIGVPLQAFADGNRSLHGQEIEGAIVLSPEEASRRFGPKTLFVIAIWTGTARESMAERIAFLHGIGCAHVCTYAPLVWAGGGDETPFHSFDLPTRMLAQADRLRCWTGLLADAESQEVWLAALRQRLRGEFSAAVPALNQYFPADLPALRLDEAVVDGGAYNGDTLAEFIAQIGAGFSAWHAFEPDPHNVACLRERIERLPAALRGAIHIHPVALHASSGTLDFVAHGRPDSQLALTSESKVPAVALDEALADFPLTFLKLDVEGAERAALLGARKLISRHGPRVAVCVYHRPEDLWELPLLLHDLLPRHRFYLRQHGFDGWEIVCYAVSA